jgi:hypothetical protein
VPVLMEESLPSLEIISVHFGLRAWTERLIKNCIEFCSVSGNRYNLKSIYIADNARCRGNKLFFESIGDVVHVVSFTRDEKQFSLYGHDHAASLEKLISLTTADIVIILDNDAHPIKERWLIRIDELLSTYDAVTARDNRLPDLSHPSFMVFRRKCLHPPLSFDTLRQDGLDVGRSIRRQLLQRGLNGYIPQVSSAFNGTYGQILDGIVYHHGSASFAFSPKHVHMANPYNDFFAQRVLFRRRYSRTLMDRILLFFISRLRLLRMFLKAIIN